MNYKDITNQVVQMGKRYKTRDGLDVEVLKTDLKCTLPVVVVITLESGEEVLRCFRNNGSYGVAFSSACDLIEVSPYDEFQIDDKVGVSNDGMNWHKRHFAGVSSDGRAMVFDKGMTSWSSSGRKSLWNYCVRDGGL
jgi:hypothetical protein